jgi:hypothetical protein
MVMMVKDPQVMELVEEVVEQDLVDLMLLNLLLHQQHLLVVRVLLFLG